MEMIFHEYDHLVIIAQRIKDHPKGRETLGV